MIKFLKIQSLILIESMEISFADGFNVLSGETGSGKSAITEGLKTLFGYKGDTSIIRHGCEKAVVEAVIDISPRKDVWQLLQDSGIDPDEDLLIKREICAHGKNRAFINHQPVQISLLKKLGVLLFNLVGQHANQQLFSIDEHRKLIDDFGAHAADVSHFSAKWKEEQELTATLRDWEINEAKRLRELEICKMEINEFHEANIKEGEDEELFEEYALLSSTEERLQAASEVAQLLGSEKVGIPLLKKQKYNLEKLAKQDPTTADLLQGYCQGLCELEEVHHQLRAYLNKQDADPSRLQKVGERLTLISKMQKKYGPGFAEMQSYFKDRQKQLDHLENGDTHIEELKEKALALRSSNLALLEQISEKRRKAALHLQEKLTKEIQQLNMAKAECFISIEKQPPHSLGQDRIEFFIKPNAGEKAIPIRDGASGGELARILLALKTVMAGKEDRSILIFDEVDANIGGATAAIIGEKLKELGKVHQVICITHFPQVARFADHHLRIYKKEKEARTLTFVELLNATSQQRELARMQGGLEISS